MFENGGRTDAYAISSPCERDWRDGSGELNRSYCARVWYLQIMLFLAIVCKSWLRFSPNT